MSMRCLFLASLAFITCSALTCPPEWDLNPVNNRCYYGVNRPMPQSYAERYCQSLDKDAYLVRVRSKDENAFLREYAYNGDVWIGAKAKFDIIDSQAGLFTPGLVLRWQNDKPAKYTNWDSDSGALEMSKDKQCVSIDSKGRWSNSNCSKRKNFVCEKRAHIHITVKRKCPTDWVYFDHTKSCYHTLANQDLNMLSADMECFKEGQLSSGEEATLTSIGDSRENRFVHDLAKRRNHLFKFVLLGGYGNAHQRNAWKWIDGSSFSPYQNWDSSLQKHNRKMVALLMNRSGHWLNYYADRNPSPGRTVAVCKFSL
ncbi:hypothetical protein L596_010017 [Steinernema carpocapsae]|uniref:C-type lectin domain-containing protein n=1 Tax=Steinernema carpocapsae TaxID=34508 RepID=A0A4U5PH22_STECR|nr:hypothetical protein L596_010017 [Steinernema carpocapsae]